MELPSGTAVAVFSGVALTSVGAVVSALTVTTRVAALASRPASRISPPVLASTRL